VVERLGPPEPRGRGTPTAPAPRSGYAEETPSRTSTDPGSAPPMRPYHPDLLPGPSGTAGGFRPGTMSDPSSH
jgi:hypothetical protein